MADVFTFDESTHVYKLNGVVLPSITQLIKPLVDYGHVPPAVLANAAEFGKKVHRMAELEETGTLDDETLDEKLRPVLAAYREWRSTNGIIPADAVPACEIPMFHKKKQFAGTPDLIFDGLAVVEIKTRKTNRLTDAIQLAAQEMLWTANGGKVANYSHHVIELYADGRHKLETFSSKEMKEAKSRFMYLLDYHYMKLNIETWRKAV
jgi:hypothetical protein